MSLELFATPALLFLPASNPRAIAKARQSGADAVVLDLEDAVKAEDKAAARAAAVTVAAEPWPMPVAIRINGAGTAEHDDDLAAALGSACDLIVVPMADRPLGISGKPVAAMIETAAGVLAAPAIARTVSALIVGTNDLAADLRLPGVDRSAMSYALQATLLAGRAAGIAVFDGVFNAIDDALPWITIFDDHEVANNAWANGAENHQADEGDYLARRAQAMQAAAAGIEELAQVKKASPAFFERLARSRLRDPRCPPSPTLPRKGGGSRPEYAARAHRVYRSRSPRPRQRQPDAAADHEADRGRPDHRGQAEPRRRRADAARLGHVGKVVVGVLGVLGWEQFFTQFHSVFFASGTWTFSLQDTLIRLFPGQFWVDAGIVIGCVEAIRHRRSGRSSRSSAAPSSAGRG